MEKKVSLKEYVQQHNPERTRRGKRMTESYIYRLIRQDLGRDKKHPTPTRDLWFKYELEGEKERIWIILPN